MAQLELVHPSPLDLTNAQPRGDHFVISQMVSDSARVLDVGCADGALMQLLKKECGAKVRGLELDPNKAHRCVVRGLSVVQGDAERDLSEFPSGAFDYVVFSHTLQHFRRPQAALKQAGRIGAQVIVSLSNAGRFDKRLQMLTKGTLGSSPHLQRYTVRDFANLAREMNFSIERAVPLTRGHAGAPFAKTIWRANWFCEEAVFLLTP